MPLILKDTPFLRNILIQRVAQVLSTRVVDLTPYHGTGYISRSEYLFGDVDERAKLLTNIVINEQVLKMFNLLYIGKERPLWEDMIKEILTMETEKLAALLRVYR